MKKTLFLFLAFSIVFFNANAASTESANASEKSEKLGAFKSSFEKDAAESFSKMTRKDYELLTGKHLNLFERLAFKSVQNNVKRQLKKANDLTEGFNLGGFLLGFLLGIFGALGVLIFSKDANMRKWAWIGFGISAVLGLIFLLI